MVYLYRAQQTAGFELRIVPAEGDLTVSTERMLDAIDDTTAIVAVSHVLFRTSYIMDADAIARRARQVGAMTMLDTYQSAGIIPVDVESLGVDFAVGGCLKWLCGGPGNAFLYTRPDRLKDAAPSFTGWLSRKHPFDFDLGSDLDSLVFDRSSTDVVETRESRSDPRRDDAMRMMNGTPSIPSYYAALAGLEIINSVGVERIREASRTMTARLLALVDRYGFTSAASRDPDRLAGTVAVDVPDALLVSRTLKARDFIVDYRPPVGIRISPHFYNTMDEIDRVMAEIAAIAAAKDYADGGTSSLVT
jgi:kynureninase